MPIRTRFAPSPTGSLHVGGARTALYCLLVARQSNGEFVLRIEDTDRARSSEEATAGIVRDMAWLGLDWDEGPNKPPQPYGPCRQSERLDTYNPLLDELVSKGLAYEAWETGPELQAMRKEAESKKENFRYRRIHYTDAQLEQFREEGRKPVLRLAVERKPVTVEDRILGAVTVDDDTVDDLVIRKADGYPTYHFAVVADDHAMGIDMILRGQEHLMNTHKHAHIYESLGWEPVAAGHLPVIFNPSGSKMSKRDKAKTARAAAREEGKTRGTGKDYGWLAEATGADATEVDRFMRKKSDSVPLAETIAATLSLELPMIEVMDFRKAGVLPEALINYLALLGWSPGDDLEIMSLDELIEKFSLDRVNKTAAKFDTTKLLWMSGEYMKALPDDVLQTRLQQWLEVVDSPLASLDADQLKTLVSMYRQRAQTFTDLEQRSAFFFEAPKDFAPKAVKKHLLKGDGLAHLKLARELLAATEFDADELNHAIVAKAESLGMNQGKINQPVRVAISGTGVTPGIGETLAWLGKNETLRRIDHCLAVHTAANG